MAELVAPVDMSKLQAELAGLRYRILEAVKHAGDKGAVLADLGAAQWRLNNIYAAMQAPAVRTDLDVAKFTAKGFKPEQTGAAFDWGFMQGIGSSVGATLTVPKAARAEVIVKYACMADSALNVLVQGKIAAALPLPKTGNWFDVYKEAKVAVDLPAGDVELALSATSIVSFNVAGVAVGAACALKSVAPPAADPVTESPEHPQADAFAFTKGLKVGVNVERGRSWYMGDFGSGVGSWHYFKNLGVTHVRLFYPWRPSLNMGGSGGVDQKPSGGDFQRILAPAKNAINAGLKVILDLTDVMGKEDFEGSRQDMVDSYLEMASLSIADARFDKSMIAIGAVNEWAGGDGGDAWADGNNATYNGHRARVNAILRKNLPGYCLVTGAAYWKHYEQLLKSDFQTSPDPLMIYDVHAYDWNANDAGHWNDVSAKLSAWSKEKNAPVIFGEAGLGWSNSGLSHAEEWAPILSTVLTMMASFAPCMWAITDGNEWRLNVDSGWKLRPSLEGVLKAL